MLNFRGEFLSVGEFVGRHPPSARWYLYLALSTPAVSAHTPFPSAAGVLSASSPNLHATLASSRPGESTQASVQLSSEGTIFAVDQSYAARRRHLLPPQNSLAHYSL